MYTLISYDIVSNRRRRLLHKFLKEFGLNTQLSIFECDLTPKNLEKIKHFVMHNLNQAEDSFLIYGFCRHCYQKAVVSGTCQGIDILDFKII